MDYDAIIESHRKNSTERSDISLWPLYRHEIVYTAIALLSALANSLTILTIRTKDYTQTTTFSFIQNIAISDTLHMISIPANFVFFERIFDNANLSCFTYELECIFQSTTVILVTLFFFDFTIKKRTYRSTIFSVWFLAILNALVCVAFCIAERTFPLPSWLVFLSYSSLFIIYVLRLSLYGAREVGTEEDTSRFRFILVTIYLVSWLVLWICLLLVFIKSLDQVLFNISNIFTGVGYAYGGINLVALILLDNKFKACVFETLTCKFIKHSNNDNATILLQERA